MVREFVCEKGKRDGGTGLFHPFQMCSLMSAHHTSSLPVQTEVIVRWLTNNHEGQQSFDSLKATDLVSAFDSERHTFDNMLNLPHLPFSLLNASNRTGFVESY